MAISRGDRAQAYCFSNHFLWPLVSRCCSRRRLSALASSNAPQPHTIFAVAIFANWPSAYDSIGFNVCTFRLLPVDAAWPLPTQELQCGGAGRSMHRQFRACRALSAARARVPWDDALALFNPAFRFYTDTLHVHSSNLASANPAAAYPPAGPRRRRSASHRRRAFAASCPARDPPRAASRAAPAAIP